MSVSLAFNVDDADMRVTPETSPARFGVLAFLAVLTFILYLDRVCIGQAAPLIQKEMNLDSEQMGLIMASFTLAYGIFMIPAGWMGDRFGSRTVLMVIVVWWSVFTALTGVVSGFIALVIVRFLFGAGEAGALPNAARMIARWFKPESRGFPQGLMNTAALLGGASAPFVAIKTIVWIDGRVAPWAAEYGLHLTGWRVSFYLFGFLGLLWALLFWIWYREVTPEISINESAPESIDPPVPVKPSALDWSRVLTSPTVWLMGLINTCASAVSYMYMSWYPSYLQNGRGVQPVESGEMTTVVLMGGALGSLVGGILSDRMIRITRERRWSRAMIGSFGMGISSAGLLIAPLFESAWNSSWVLCIGFFGGMLMIAAWWGVVADVSGRYVATLFGLMNGLGIFGAIASQIYVGRMVKTNLSLNLVGRDAWDPMFQNYAIVAGIGAIAWLFVNANRKVHSNAPTQPPATTS